MIGHALVWGVRSARSAGQNNKQYAIGQIPKNVRLQQPVHGRPVLADPFTAAEDLDNASDIAGNIMIAVRGGSTFAKKIQRAVAAGAIAVIVINDNKEDPQEVFSMGMEGSDFPNVIPSIMISYRDGQALVVQMPESVTIQSVGECSPRPTNMR